jgi:hypothetical protein
MYNWLDRVIEGSTIALITDALNFTRLVRAIGFGTSFNRNSVEGQDKMRTLNRDFVRDSRTPNHHRTCRPSSSRAASLLLPTISDIDVPNSIARGFSISHNFLRRSVVFSGLGKLVSAYLHNFTDQVFVNQLKSSEIERGGAISTISNRISTPLNQAIQRASFM